MKNIITQIRQQRLSFSTFFLLILVIFVGLYFYWPKLSILNILSPTEQEVHGYLKEIIPAVRSTLQKLKQLDEDPAKGTFVGELGSLSDEILNINGRYWKTKTMHGTETFVRILSNKVRGRKEKAISFLAHWQGPEQDPDSLYKLRIDTRTLIYRAWEIKENSNKLANKLKNLLRGWKAKGKHSTQEITTIIETCWRTLGDVDQVYRRWKGNYRPPFSFSS